MKNSARGELVEPCELRVSVVELFRLSPFWLQRLLTEPS
jgi:hypothetical protein